MRLFIPVGAEARRLRFLFDTKSGGTPSSGVEEYWDGDINWVTPEDLGKLGDRYVRETRRRITEEGYKNSAVSLALPGSIVLSKRAPIGQTAILAEPSTCNQGCFLLTSVDDVDERFYYYALIHLRPALEALGRGSTFMELSADDLRSVPLPFPNHVDQKLIADYLDREIARIDGLVAEKERMLVLLEEKREALISHVVTRGLDPKAPLKPSGQEWLGEIPANWETKPMRYVSSLNPAVSFAMLKEEDEVTFLPMEKIKNGYYLPDVEESLAKYSASYNAFEEGDILLAKVTPCFENGNVTIAENLRNGRGFGTSEIFVLRPIGIERRFLFYYLQSVRFKQEGEASMTGAAGLKRVSSDLLRQHHIPLPPCEEQRMIALYLDREMARTKAIETAIARSVGLLQERRSSLITAAVTGQIPLKEMTE